MSLRAFHEQMRKKIIINGKFLLAALEGMPRVGREITAGFDHLLDHPEYSDISIEILTPKGGHGKASYKNIKIREVGRFNGPFWEQVELPLHTMGAYCLNFTGTAPIIKTKGCVVVHDAQFRSTSQSHSLKSFLLYNMVTTCVSRRYKTVITVSDYAKREIQHYKVTSRDDIHVVPNAVDHVLRFTIDPGVLAKHGLHDRGYALANSYIYAHKNVKTLLDAFAKFPADYPLVLFGSSKKAQYDAKGIAVPPNVRFLGRVSDEDLVSLMAQARMFLFPSTTEGFGLPPLEAMQLGCPTITARAGAMTENCGDGAIYADPYSVEDWMRKISTLWNDKEERDRVSRAGIEVANRFRWLTSARAYLDIILHDA
jgi:glycosyltransferase involved in cell wall biosynthesis